MTSNDAVGNAQAEAGTLPHRLGGKEWLEHPPEIFGHDATAVVAHPDAEPFSSRIKPRINPDVAPRAHGVCGIHQQVQEHLVQLPGVSGNHGKFRQIEVHTNALLESIAQEY